MISISVCVGFNETVDPSVRFQSIRENNGDKSVLNPIQETVACVNQRTQILAGKTEEKRLAGRRLGMPHRSPVRKCELAPALEYTWYRKARQEGRKTGNQPSYPSLPHTSVVSE